MLIPHSPGATPTMNVAVIRKTQVSRSLKILVPLIQDELIAGNEAGMDHYIKAGQMLNEVKDSGQVTYSSWGRWLQNNFTLSQNQAGRYMKAARNVEADATLRTRADSLRGVLGIKPEQHKTITKKNKLKSLFDGVDQVNVTRLADERQTREDEVQLHREIALKL